MDGCVHSDNDCIESIKSSMASRRGEDVVDTSRDVRGENPHSPSLEFAKEREECLDNADLLCFFSRNKRNLKISGDATAYCVHV